MNRTAVLLLLINLGLGSVSAQGVGESPYSAYGFGDLVHTGQVTQTLMGGTGLAISEPLSVIMGNPASYASLARPVFEIGTSVRLTRTSSATASSTQKDARFQGFSIGVPFGKGKWGLALGLTPFSEVDYTSARNSTFDGGTVKYVYTGSGGLDRAFFGLGRTLYQQRKDSVGNSGTRVSFGADFNFIFGSIEQTRQAIYSPLDGFNNTKIFSALVLRAPTGDASLMWEGDLTKKKDRDDNNWRWSVGAFFGLPTGFNAKYYDLVTSYSVSGGIDNVRDTITGQKPDKGRVEVPASFGLGMGVQNANWAFIAEVKQRDWSAVKIDVPGYELPARMRSSMTYAAGVRFQPRVEGGVFQRAVYRAGMRYVQSPQEVRGMGLSSTVAALGISFPLNAVQTNSWLHVGGEFGKRGTTDNGLVEERFATLWLGVAFTPWRGERWFTPPKIQ